MDNTHNINVDYTFPIFINGEAKDTFTLPQVPFWLFYAWFRAVNTEKIDTHEAQYLAYLGAWVAKIYAARHQQFGDQPIKPEVHREEWDCIRSALQGLLLENQPFSRGNAEFGLERTEDLVIGFCYLLIRTRRLDYDQAAAFASQELQQPISREALRLRIIRWIERYNMPPLGLKRGRTPKKRTNTI